MSVSPKWRCTKSDTSSLEHTRSAKVNLAKREPTLPQVKRGTEKAPLLIPSSLATLVNLHPPPAFDYCSTCRSRR
ncbi:hypothetical protein TNCV_1055151 [Trichonephila clavipes]|nr:hypothetical protein TNCV_1055151 [Trichonephila clavipes]